MQCYWFLSSFVTAPLNCQHKLVFTLQCSKKLSLQFLPAAFRLQNVDYGGNCDISLKLAEKPGLSIFVNRHRHVGMSLWSDWILMEWIGWYVPIIHGPLNCAFGGCLQETRLLTHGCKLCSDQFRPLLLDEFIMD